MKQLLKEGIKRTPLFPVIESWIAARHQKKEQAAWEASGRPAPPPHAIKQKAIKSYAQQFGLQVLVETGTYCGDMVEAMKPYFNQIYSIELGQELYEKAKERFAGDDRIILLQGDSGVELGKLLEHLDQPALFWLDGHYSAGITAKGEKDTPVFEELTHIFNHAQKGHVILIDDARCFGKDPAYPSLEELSAFVLTHRPEAEIDVENDSIRIVPNRSVA